MQRGESSEGIVVGVLLHGWHKGEEGVTLVVFISVVGRAELSHQDRSVGDDVRVVTGAGIVVIELSRVDLGNLYSVLLIVIDAYKGVILSG